MQWSDIPLRPDATTAPPVRRAAGWSSSAPGAAGKGWCGAGRHSPQGRGEDATDPDGSFVAEFFVPLKPFEEWPDGLTKPKLVREMAARLESEFIGVDFNFSRHIQDNIEEAVSGVKGENSVKIFGRDLAELERLSKAVQDELAKVPGVADAGAFNLLGQPNLVIQVDRAKAARYGITVSPT